MNSLRFDVCPVWSEPTTSGRGCVEAKQGTATTDAMRALSQSDEDHPRCQRREWWWMRGWSFP
jgi:hypothetical protein